MPSVTGRRPIETSTWSTSIFSEPFGVSNGTTTPSSVCSQRADPGLGVDLGAALLQRLGQHVGAVAVGPDRQHAVRQRLEQRGVARRGRCRRRRTRPRSRRRRSPRPARAAVGAGSLVDWSEVITRTPSTSMPGMARGTEPGADDRRPCPRSVWPSTATAPSAVSVPKPVDDGDLAPLEQAGQAAVQLVDDAGLALVRRGPVRLGRRRASLTPCSPACETVRNTSAACSSALAGMQPRCRQVPPTFSFSTIATVSPADAAYSAAAYPPGTAAEHHEVVVSHGRASSCPRHLPQRLGDLRGLRDHRVLQRRAGRRRGVLRPDPHHRLVEVPEALLLDGRRDLRAVAQPLAPPRAARPPARSCAPS